MTAGEYFRKTCRLPPDGLSAESEGYHVIYSKGTPEEYHSWSPKKAFDDGYKEI